jgi:glutamyl-tRNA reductase
MNIIAVGISHQKAPIELREKFFLNLIERELFLAQFKQAFRACEAFVLSTCNRTEIYANLRDSSGHEDRILTLLCEVKKLDYNSQIKQHFYTLYNHDVVQHLYRVAAGLDSLVVGEKQILGQLKEAVDLARRQQMMGRTLNILTHLAIRTGKKAQSETKIGFGGVSVSWAAVNMLERILGTLRCKSVLIIGAGKMSELAASHLHNKGVGQIYVMNRSEVKAIALAKQFNGKIVPCEQIREIMRDVDAVICSTAAGKYILNKDLIQAMMKARACRPLVLMDISIPRNIDPQISQFENVRLLTIDDLTEVIQGSIMTRHNAIAEVENIVAEKIPDFFEKIGKTQHLPTKSASCQYALEACKS